ncbi:MAG: FtsH protease activity modulator HflK [Sphingomonas sp.]|nr:FtsH protease activity modulator HflK [Sphingomonas sp.]
MTIFLGLGPRARALFSDIKGPWGSPGGGEPDDGGDSKGSGPWGETPKRRRSGGTPRQVTSLDEFLRKGRERFGGNGGGLPGAPNRSLVTWAILGIIGLWLIFTSFHVIAPGESGVVTRFGRYSSTLGPGVSMTLPSPIDRVQKLDVENIRTIELGSASAETLVLTGDQNIIDIAYSVRWNIRDPELYLFRLKNPDETIREVAESAMRAVVANYSLNEAIGEGRGDIEARVTEAMQRILDAYRAGVVVRGVAIRQADPPQAVNEAFKKVTAAQQEAQSYINRANAYALQLTAKAQGEAAAFDKVYEQYKLAPDVTRRRMYYETMEQVLQKTPKTIVEAPGVTPYLPLPEVQKQSQQQKGEGQ